ncbi:MAG: HEAT repeat domain-containing protein, partial [Thermodesulfovibrionales bacterium]|nr:HEAT repeat domain-containing protein [Thermodesulfovibrionales bacterium]
MSPTVARGTPASKFLFTALVSVFSLLFISIPCSAQESLDDVVSAMAKKGVQVTSGQLASVRGHVVADPDGAFQKAVRRLKSRKTAEEQRAVWIWVLGLTGRPDAVQHVISQVTGDSSVMLRANADNALGELGGQEAGKYLYREFLGAKSEAYRTHLLVLMGRAGYGPAIAKSTELLKLDQYKSRYMAAFFFGSMGEQSVPFLINKLEHWSVDVRRNAAMVLGQWLLAKEAARPLISRFAGEEDPDVRKQILDSLERTMVDLNALEQFMKKVAKEDKDYHVKKFARESIHNMERMRKAVEERSRQRRPDDVVFKKAYDKAYQSRGKDSNFRLLGLASDHEDEPA